MQSDQNVRHKIFVEIVLFLEVILKSSSSCIDFNRIYKMPKKTSKNVDIVNVKIFSTKL